jgi:hypothetical protein
VVVLGLRRMPMPRLDVRAGVVAVVLDVLVLGPKRRCPSEGFVPTARVPRLRPSPLLVLGSFAGCSTVVVVVVTVVPPAW